MPWFVWICLGVFLVVLIPTVAVAAVAGLRTLRAAGSLNRELEPRVARLQTQSEDLNRRSAQATYATELAKARIASLQASLKRVDVSPLGARGRESVSAGRQDVRAAEVTRVAVCDLGTNSTRLLVADVDGGSVVEVDRRLEITKLGEDVDAERELTAPAMARVEDVVSAYAAVAENLGSERRIALATSAVRDAANGPAFLERIERSFGFPTRLLAGNEEALLTFRGVSAGRNLERLTLVVDLGGGSTELVVGGDAGIEFHASLDIGCVRLTEQFLAADPPTADSVDRLRGAVRALLAASVPDTVRPEHGIGVAGTVTTLATLHLGLEEEDPEIVDRHVLPAAWIESTALSLSGMRLAELLELPGIAPGRAPVIASGALALSEVAAFFGLDALEVSERDLLHGAALELAG